VLQITLHDVADLRLSDVAMPDAPPPGWVQVRVRRVGVCGTDLHAYAGRQPFFRYPRVLGHELAVTVHALGDGVLTVAVGDDVAVRPYLECGRCRACRTGRTNCCEQLTVLGVHIDGGMSQFINLPATHLHHAHGVALDGLALVEMLSIGFHAVRRANPRADDTVVVVGLGPIGLGVCLAARARGLAVIAVDPSPNRRAFASDQRLVAQAIDPGTDVVAAVRAACGGSLPDVVLDATGHPAAMEASFGLPVNSGTLVFVGLVQGDLRFADSEFHRREVTLLASRNATATDFDAVIAALPSIDIVAWVTHRTTPATLATDMPLWRDPGYGVIKGMLDMDASPIC
jgi:threonine dehydrogenase-like Zn-dependent dehydrogenase